jgi:hypothetical protein
MRLYAGDVWVHDYGNSRVEGGTAIVILSLYKHDKYLT